MSKQQQQQQCDPIQRHTKPFVCSCVCVCARCPYSGRQSQRYLSSFCFETQTCICLLHTPYHIICAITSMCNDWMTDWLSCGLLTTQRTKQKPLTLDSNTKRPPLCVSPIKLLFVFNLLEHEEKHTFMMIIDDCRRLAQNAHSHRPIHPRKTENSITHTSINANMIFLRLCCYKLWICTPGILPRSESVSKEKRNYMQCTQTHTRSAKSQPHEIFLFIFLYFSLRIIESIDI